MLKIIKYIAIGFASFILLLLVIGIFSEPKNTESTIGNNISESKKSSQSNLDDKNLLKENASNEKNVDLTKSDVIPKEKDDSLTVVDVMADGKKMVGKTVKVRCPMINDASSLFIYCQDDDNFVSMRPANLKSEDYKYALLNCSKSRFESKCSGVAKGTVGVNQVSGGTFLNVKSIDFNK
jgi:hypothetical protein